MVLSDFESHLLGLYLGPPGSLAFQRFSWVQLGFTGFDWVSWFFYRFYWVVLGLLGFAVSGLVLLRFPGFSLSFTGFYWVLPGFT